MSTVSFYLPGPWEILILGGCFLFFLLLVGVAVLVVVLVVKRGRPPSAPPAEGSEAKSPADTQNAHATTNPDRD